MEELALAVVSQAESQGRREARRVALSLGEGQADPGGVLGAPPALMAELAGVIASRG